MDGVLVVDKPQGLTSHDVVAAARRVLNQRRMGHTGTLDPLASGVLPLACGQATRLVRFLVASDKDYEATIRFGLTTDSDDVSGREIGRSGKVPSREDLIEALGRLQGARTQIPPAYSAKKVAGQRAYALVRADQPVTLAPVPVRLSHVELVGLDGTDATVTLTCSAGYYVRAFARDLGVLVGTGACLAALRRTRSGAFGLDRAVTMEQLPAARQWLLGLDSLLTHIPAVVVTVEGRTRVAHGRQVHLAHTLARDGFPATEWARLVDERGHLLALAVHEDGQLALRPKVVLI